MEKICTRVIIIDKGTIVADDSVRRLSQLMELASLESIFKKLDQQQDTAKMADDIIGVIQSPA